MTEASAAPSPSPRRSTVPRTSAFLALAGAAVALFSAGLYAFFAGRALDAATRLDAAIPATVLPAAAAAEVLEAREALGRNRVVLGGLGTVAILGWVVGVAGAARGLARDVQPTETARQLDAALARERQLSSDLAHELRTPIAELRSLADVGGRWPEDREAVEGFFADVGEIAHRMERTITDLLRLARSEGGLESVELREVELAPVVAAAFAPLAEEAARRELTWQSEVPDGLRLRTDPEKLELVLHNLLKNAVAYSRRGGTVEARATHHQGRVRIFVVNPPRELDAADVPRMFDRFWRKDPARSSQLNAGLGLAIARAFCDLLGLEVAARLEKATLTVEIAEPP